MNSINDFLSLNQKIHEKSLLINRLSQKERQVILIALKALRDSKKSEKVDSELVKPIIQKLNEKISYKKQKNPKLRVIFNAIANFFHLRISSHQVLTAFENLASEMIKLKEKNLSEEIINKKKERLKEFNDAAKLKKAPIPCLKEIVLFYKKLKAEKNSKNILRILNDKIINVKKHLEILKSKEKNKESEAYIQVYESEILQSLINLSKSIVKGDIDINLEINKQFTAFSKALENREKDDPLAVKYKKQEEKDIRILNKNFERQKQLNSIIEKFFLFNK